MSQVQKQHQQQQRVTDNETKREEHGENEKKGFYTGVKPLVLVMQSRVNSLSRTIRLVNGNSNRLIKYKLTTEPNDKLIRRLIIIRPRMGDIEAKSYVLIKVELNDLKATKDAFSKLSGQIMVDLILEYHCQIKYDQLVTNQHQQVTKSKLRIIHIPVIIVDHISEQKPILDEKHDSDVGQTIRHRLASIDGARVSYELNDDAFGSIDKLAASNKSDPLINSNLSHFFPSVEKTIIEPPQTQLSQPLKTTSSSIDQSAGNYNRERKKVNKYGPRSSSSPSLPLQTSRPSPSPKKSESIINARQEEIDNNGVHFPRLFRNLSYKLNLLRLNGQTVVMRLIRTSSLVLIMFYNILLINIIYIMYVNEAWSYLNHHHQSNEANGASRHQDNDAQLDELRRTSNIMRLAKIEPIGSSGRY